MGLLFLLSQAPEAGPGETGQLPEWIRYREFDSPLPGPQLLGTEGTLSFIECRMRPGAPSAL
jgi:hypothetical protein